ncbi:MAG: hypothetical protein IK023_04595, partial [Bacteroidaceae bacterium]|nr:hypothetical protein [Bacteroidaceae bacterium]
MKKILFIVAMVVAVGASGQLSRLTDTLQLHAELTATLSHGDYSPYWMSNNRYGVASVNPRWGAMRLGVSRSQMGDAGRKWQTGYGLEFAPVIQSHDSRFVVQQAYLDIQYKKLRLSVGAKERPSELRNQALSAGGLTSGINSRPIPQLRVELPDFWDIPGTHGWLGLKARLGYGFFTDNGWQQDFVDINNSYTKNSLYHTKAGWLRIGNEEKFPLTFTGGLEMNTQFGGTRYRKGTNEKLHLKSDLG